MVLIFHHHTYCYILISTTKVNNKELIGIYLFFSSFVLAVSHKVTIQRIRRQKDCMYESFKKYDKKNVFVNNLMNCDVILKINAYLC